MGTRRRFGIKTLQVFGVHTGAMALVLYGLWPNGAQTSWLVAVLALAALNAALWLLFDRLMAPCADTRTEDPAADTPPAHDAVADSRPDTAHPVKAQPVIHSAQLTDLIAETPLGLIMTDGSGQIVLYNAQARQDLLGSDALRLGAALADCFNAADVDATLHRLRKKGLSTTAVLRDPQGLNSFDLYLTPLPNGAIAVAFAQAPASVHHAGLVHDLDLLMTPVCAPDMQTPIRRLAFTVLSTRATGFLPHKDAVYQISARRIVNGKLVQDDALDLTLHPDTTQPQDGSEFHAAAKRLHSFANGSVIVAQNAALQMAFFRFAETRHGLVWDHPVLEPTQISNRVLGASAPQDLASLCTRFDIARPQATPSAARDAKALAQVMTRLLDAPNAETVLLGDTMPAAQA